MDDDEEYFMDNSKCDISSGFITGGILVKKEEFPHMAAIGSKDNEGKATFHCGGSLISDRFVLTAAHCSSSG